MIKEKNYRNGDEIVIEGERFVIGKTIKGGYVLIEDKYFTPADADDDGSADYANSLDDGRSFGYGESYAERNT